MTLHEASSQEKQAEKAKRQRGLKALFTLVAVTWWYPFVMMLALGSLHDRYASVPAAGFWEVWVVMTAVSTMLYLWRGKTAKA